MALGKPIVTTDNAGCREVIEDGVNGFMIPVRDARALADRILRLVDDTGLRKMYGRHSRTKAESEFSAETVISRVLDEVYGLG
jgi:N,N'-diacetylbacillosaminyl-diphospho-undecaprenol alpha-1,3-N-acetylgalactosaminyltransferase